MGKFRRDSPREFFHSSEITLAQFLRILEKGSSSEKEGKMMTGIASLALRDMIWSDSEEQREFEIINEKGEVRLLETDLEVGDNRPGQRSNMA